MAYTTVVTQTLTVKNAELAQRGFLKLVVDHVARCGKRGVKTETLVKQFVGKRNGGRKITAERVTRYAYYCVRHGILKAQG